MSKVDLSKMTPGPWRRNDGHLHHQVISDAMPRRVFGQQDQFSAPYIVCQPALYSSPKDEELEANITGISATYLIPELQDALAAISAIGGTLPDESLTDKTGPNDARARGLMYCEARRVALAMLTKLNKQLEGGNGE